jgi:hypothetical protein
MERETGIEPVTSSLGSWRSTAELLPLKHSEPNHNTGVVSGILSIPIFAKPILARPMLAVAHRFTSARQVSGQQIRNGRE